MEELKEFEPELLDVKVGEIVVFLPEDYDISLWNEIISAISDNEFHFQVRIVTTSDYLLWKRLCVRAVNIFDEDKASYIIGETKEATKEAYRGLTDKLLHKLRDFAGDTSSNFRRVLTVVYDGPRHIHASAVDFFSSYDEDASIEDNLDEEQRDFIEKISGMALDFAAKYKRMPPLNHIRELVAGHLALERYGVSRLRVTPDCRLFLTDYGDAEIKMSPLAKAVYLLFLNHPAGIRLKDIGDYREELQEIYLKIKPGADPELAEERVADIAVAGSESLNQKISMTRNAIRRVILSEALAEKYLIRGCPGEPYFIDLCVYPGKIEFVD